MHQQVQHSESSTLHTLTPPDELIKGLVKAVKVAPNEKCENFPRKIGALTYTFWSLLPTYGRQLQAYRATTYRYADAVM